MVTSHLRGHAIYYADSMWKYTDTGTSIAAIRPCKRCGKFPTKEGYDACTGFIAGAVSACCGHGIHDSYVIMGRKETI